MITRSQAIELYEAADLIEIGMAADAVRKLLHPGEIVGYGAFDSAEQSIRVEFRVEEPIRLALDILDEVRARILAHTQPVALLPISDGTAVDYLRALSFIRLYFPETSHMQTSIDFGAKLAQIALRFGANDISVVPTQGSVRPRATEEEVRLLIRDAGFVPKLRDPLFRFYALN